MLARSIGATPPAHHAAVRIRAPAVLVEAMPAPYRTPTMIAATTGLRLGEVLALRWDVIDLEAPRLHVVATLQQEAREVYVESPKTDRARRTVPIQPMTVAVLRRHRADQLERRLLFGEEWPDLGLVCDRGDGTPIRPMTLSRTFVQIAEREDLGAVRFHDLRHAYATSLLEAESTRRSSRRYSVTPRRRSRWTLTSTSRR